MAKEIPDQLKKTWTISTKEDSIVFVSNESFKTDYPGQQVHLSYEMKIINRISDEEILKRVQTKNEKSLKLNSGTCNRLEWETLDTEISKIDVPVYTYPHGNVLICTKQGLLGHISNIYAAPCFDEIEKYILEYSYKLYEKRL